MRLRSIFILTILFISLVSFAEVNPTRTQGISIHMLPKRVADIGNKLWGLSVDYAPYLKAEARQPIIQSTSEFLAYVRKQERPVQDNGVWIVTTDPDAYSEAEVKLLEDIKNICKKEHIALFVSRASELPDGWKRY